MNLLDGTICRTVRAHITKNYTICSHRLFCQRQSAETVKVARSAQGISMGSEVEYADEATLSRAIQSRAEM